MVVAIALAAAAVLAAVVVLAMGRGGELAEVHPDYPLLPHRGDQRVSAMDPMMLRLPRAWGYHIDTTDEVLRRFTYALSERDARIAMLERQVAELRQTVEPRDQIPSETSWYTPSPETPWSPPDATAHLENHGRVAYGPEPPPALPSLDHATEATEAAEATDAVEVVGDQTVEDVAGHETRPEVSDRHPAEDAPGDQGPDDTEPGR